MIELATNHQTLQMIDNVDMGLVLIDRTYSVEVWNKYMQSYSGITAEKIVGKNLFHVYENLPQELIKSKINTAIITRSRTFCSWEGVANIFPFEDFAPVSRNDESMYQNVVFTPIVGLDTEISHISISIYDVTDMALTKLGLLKSNKKLFKLGTIDGLTGLLNRAYWESLVNAPMKCDAIESTESFILCDIDHFKVINDTYGHSVGDQVIKNTASIFKSVLRNTDLCGRYGGEEFAIFLPGCNVAGAQLIAERLRRKIESQVLDISGHSVKWTMSFGVIQRGKQETKLKLLLEEADKALYLSKNNGRNQVSVAQSV